MAKMRMYDAWENLIVNLPAEVQEYIDGINGAVLDCYSMSYGTPDGNVYCVEYTVTWVKGHSIVTTKEFLYDFGAEGEKFRIAKDEKLVDACSVLRWAHRLIEESAVLAEHWDFMSKKAGVA
jgi:hypothetical protein